MIQLEGCWLPDCHRSTTAHYALCGQNSSHCRSHTLRVVFHSGHNLSGFLGRYRSIGYLWVKCAQFYKQTSKLHYSVIENCLSNLIEARFQLKFSEIISYAKRPFITTLPFWNRDLFALTYLYRNRRAFVIESNQHQIPNDCVYEF